MDLNIPKLNIKLSGADEALEKYNLLIQKIKEANALASELASTMVKIEFALPEDASTE